MREEIIATDYTVHRIVEEGIEEYGNTANLNHINMSKVTDISHLFFDSDFNGNISLWDVSNVVNMRSAFHGASNFNQDLSGWNTSKVVNMSAMFFCAVSFNRPLNWDTSSVITMEGMFEYATSFNHPLNWKTPNVENMRGMFSHAKSFNQNLKLDITQVKNMVCMFWRAASLNQDLSDWKIGQDTDIKDAFLNCEIEERYKFMKQ